MGLDVFGGDIVAWSAAPVGVLAALCQLSLFWRPDRTDDAS